MCRPGGAEEWSEIVGSRGADTCPGPFPTHPPASPATALWHLLTWLIIAVAGLVALATTFSYLGAFPDPDGNARGMPLALVNEDRGATIGREAAQLRRAGHRHGFGA